MKKILILGSGAVGRGFLPWVFPPSEFEYCFDDTNESLLNKLYKRKKYTTWCTKDGRYEPLTVKATNRIPKDIDLICIAVGARNFLGLSERFMRTETPIICCENDARLVPKMKEITGNQNIFFAVPDVITSNTAPQKLLDIDPLSIVTEDGVMYVEEGAEQFLADKMIKRTYLSLSPTVRYDNNDLIKQSNGLQYKDETISHTTHFAKFLSEKDMHREWMAKLYIHNTPHCITAYLGHKAGKQYIHEAMEIQEIKDTIYGVVLETGAMVQKVYGLDEEFTINYALKELTRFNNPLLFDPISRVAREPMRKLAIGERLIGAAMLCLQVGIVPENIIKGIVAAIHYCEPKDPDYRIMKLFKQLEVEDFVEGILHLRHTEKLYPLLVEALK